MIIIHGMDVPPHALPRLLTGAVERAARAMPVVVVTGARQTGKSTLVRGLLSGERAYLSLDDLDVREQAERAPDELVARGERLILDEVQRAPDLLLAVKRAVDARRTRGRFILTGSANLLLARRVSESLAGRATYLTLWPMTRGELLGREHAADLFERPAAEWPELFRARDGEPADWRRAAERGGYPVPAVELEDAEDRAIWLDGYVRTYLERDLQELASIENLVDFRRLMRAACLRIGRLVNQTELGRDVQLAQPTVRRWLNLLAISYQLVRLPAYAANRTKRLIKTPKAYWCDIALARHIAGGPPLDGSHLENLVLLDLVAWRDACLVDRPEIYYWRTAAGAEVDFVVERGGALIGIEVKATARPRAADAAHLQAFRDEYGEAVRGCVLLHAGSAVETLGARIVAAPWWRAM
jgi:predicted AAA+ superfamily ATPase